MTLLFPGKLFYGDHCICETLPLGKGGASAFQSPSPVVCALIIALSWLQGWTPNVFSNMAQYAKFILIIGSLNSLSLGLVKNCSSQGGVAVTNFWFTGLLVTGLEQHSGVLTYLLPFEDPPTMTDVSFHRHLINQFEVIDMMLITMREITSGTCPTSASWAHRHSIPLTYSSCSRQSGSPRPTI